MRARVHACAYVRMHQCMCMCVCACVCMCVHARVRQEEREIKREGVMSHHGRITLHHTDTGGEGRRDVRIMIPLYIYIYTYIIVMYSR